MSSAADIASAIFLILLFLQLLLGVESFRGGIRFYRYVKNRLQAETTGFAGLVTLIVPCRGSEEGLYENLKAITSQDRGQTEILFVVDSRVDKAVPVIKRIAKGLPGSKIVVAGTAVDSGQKVHNLIKAVEAADQKSKAFVFVDSDTRPSPDWLDHLLSPLTEATVECSSGYRWFRSPRNSFANLLRIAWNASITSALGENRLSNFCWGGSTAITREQFEKLDIPNLWRGTVSDDFVLTNALHKSGVGVHFEPKCLTSTVGDIGVFELLEFTTRQMKITRTYSPRHFIASFVGSALFTLTFFPAVILLFFLEGTWFQVALALVSLIWLLGAMKSVVRLIAVRNCPGIDQKTIRSQFPAQIIMWPLSSLLFFINDLAALFSNVITWRGITYELLSDKEIRIIP